MLDDDTVSFLEGDCSLIVGLTLPDGAPFASHAWALIVDSPAELCARLVISRSVADTLPTLAERAPIAVTGADVASLASLQVKGWASDVRPATAEELATTERHVEDFMSAVERTDGEPRSLLERFVPSEFSTVTLTIEAVYDQTPGPGAGRLLAERPA